jgi:hypothetical protein
VFLGKVFDQGDFSRLDKSFPPRACSHPLLHAFEFLGGALKSRPGNSRKTIRRRKAGQRGPLCNVPQHQAQHWVQGNFNPKKAKRPEHRASLSFTLGPFYYAFFIRQSSLNSASAFAKRSYAPSFIGRPPSAKVPPNCSEMT